MLILFSQVKEHGLQIRALLRLTEYLLCHFCNHQKTIIILDLWQKMKNSKKGEKYLSHTDTLIHTHTYTLSQHNMLSIILVCHTYKEPFLRNVFNLPDF